MREYKRLTHKLTDKQIAKERHCDYLSSWNVTPLIQRLGKLEDSIDNGELIKLPTGWLEVLKLLGCAASCYAEIKQMIVERMKDSEDIADLFFSMPTVQMTVNDFALADLAEAKIDFNNLMGFEELLNAMPRFKAIAERRAQAEAKLKELLEGKK